MTNESYLTADQLRPGVFVILDLPWFKHSFALGSFKIRDTEQVRELQQLGLARYRYDPERSDLLAEDGAMAPLVTPIPTSVKALTVTEEVATGSATAAGGVGSAWREQVINLDRAFAKAITVVKNLNRNLLTHPQETMEEMGELVEQVAAAFLDSPDVTLQVMGDNAGGEDVYFHSLNVTILVMMMAKELGFTPKLARELGIGAMLHDIGLMEIPDRITRKSPDEFTQAERTLRAQHVAYGLVIGRKLGLSPEALAVIEQHHELMDGSGYPNRLKGDAITPAARLVAAVNSYDNLCNPIDISKALTPHEALSFMYAKRRDKLDSKVLQVMIRCMGVYPPGSVVQLSDETLALVTSVNPRKPLRPMVMLYDVKVPKDKATMLNLEHETAINIVKAVRPVLLTPKVAAYLNPRKRVTYFFDTGHGAPVVQGNSQ